MIEKVYSNGRYRFRLSIKLTTGGTALFFFKEEEDAERFRDK